jgi:hypothetical protein
MNDEAGLVENQPLPPCAPKVTLTAVQSGRVISAPTCRGHPVLLLFHNHRTLTAVEEVQWAVRSRYPLSTKPILANIVDLGGVPRLLRRTVRSALQAGYEQGAAAVPDGLDPDDYVIILPDWNGRVTADFALRDVGKNAAIILLDENWALRGCHQGSDLGDAALGMLDRFLDVGAQKL